MGYTNSSLINYTKISPNKTSPRNHVIDTITIHCMAGNLSVEACGSIFAKSSAEASSNYGIGSDGKVALYVEEKDRSWCSSNSANDHRAVTIEVANDGDASTGWHVSDKAMAALITLIVDICNRNNIKKLKWKGDKSLVGQVDKQNMTVHRWFAAKACPGDYLYGKHSYIAAEVNKKLGNKTLSTSPASSTNEFYRVRASTTKKTTIANNTATSTSKLKVTSTIKAVQIWLNNYYKTGLSTDGVYGTKTKAALIKAWQTEVGGLTIDGIFGTKSQTAAASHNIKKGSAGILVTIWQAFLVCKGYHPNGIDGSFGFGCHSSTTSFQKANKLTQDGIVGKNTWSKAFA